MKLQFAAPCLFGLEGIAGQELRRLDIENVQVEDRRVLFTGDLTTLAKANMCLRTVERVHILLAQFEAKSFEDKRLWARNKWLLAHKDTSEAAAGAYVGLVGENTDISAYI